MTLAELANYANLLLVPALAYIISQDRKTVRLETKVDGLAELIRQHVAREERLLNLIATKR